MWRAPFNKCGSISIVEVYQVMCGDSKAIIVHGLRLLCQCRSCSEPDRTNHHRYGTVEFHLAP